MESLLITIALALFTAITLWRFEYGLGLFLFLLPTYLIRLQIGPIPTTFLELMFAVLFFVWLARFWRHVPNTMRWLRQKHKLLVIGIALFVLGATLGVVFATTPVSALGEWKAFYIEPIVFAFMLTTIARAGYGLRVTGFVVAPILLSGLITAFFAISQHFTGWMVPHAFWANNDTYRVTAWYGFPNAVGLFLAPLTLIVFAICANTIRKIQETKKQDTRQYLYLVICILCLPALLVAIFYAKSTGAIIGVAAGIGLLLLIWRKTRWFAVAIAIVSIFSLFSIPNLSNLKHEVLLQDRSGQIRISMWQETVAFLKDHPFRGAGMSSYAERIAPYHTTVNGEGIEIFHHPHNLFLTIWLNTTVIGLIGFLLILIWFYRGSKTAHQQNSTVAPVWLMAAMTTLLVIGLVDSPYIKNDLAFLFWLLPALLLIHELTRETQSA